MYPLSQPRHTTSHVSGVVLTERQRHLVQWDTKQNPETDPNMPTDF